MGSLTEKVKEIEREEIINAMNECNWVMSRAARKLGITERIIGYKIKSYNINSKYSIGDYSGFHNGEVSASLRIPVMKSFTLTPKMAYSFPLSNDAKDAMKTISNDGDKEIFYGGINLSLSF